MGPLDMTRPWVSKAISGNFRFLRRAYALVADQKEKGFTASDTPEIEKLLHKTIKRVTEALEGLRFNTALSTLMEFVNRVGQQRITAKTAAAFALLLSPLAPHLGEELWQISGNKKSLAYEPWPVFNESLLVEGAASVVIRVNGKKRAVIEVSVDIDEGALRNSVEAAFNGTDYKMSSTDRIITVYQSGTKVRKLVNVLEG